MPPEERAREGLFLAFQYRFEIPGVNNVYLLKASLNALRQASRRAGTRRFRVPEPRPRRLAEMHMDDSLLTGASTKGFSGGEKKRNEILQMSCCSRSSRSSTRPIPGLDVDALRLVAEGVNALRSPDRAIVIVTHYQRLLDHVVPDRVHVLAGGRIVTSGGRELALELDRRGYDWIREGVATA